MRNDSLLTTFNETRHEIVVKRNACLGRLQPAQTGCDDARFALQRAQQEEREAIEQDQGVIAKMDELRNHLNAMADKPHSLTEKLDSLRADQVQSYGKRQAAGEMTRRRQRELAAAETRRDIVLADLKKVDGDLAELDAQIRDARGYSL
jgi:chromosome segregation ATPase